MILGTLKFNRKWNINALLKNYNTLEFMKEKNSTVPKVSLPRSVPKPKDFYLSLELNNLKQIKTSNMMLISKYPTDHYIGLMFSSVLSTNYNIKTDKYTNLKGLYCELTSYLNLLLEIILTNNDRVSKLSVYKLNDLLISLGSINLRVRETLDLKIDEIMELIFNSKFYKGGYNKLTIDELLLTIGKSKNAPILYAKLNDYLIRDNFKFDEPNLQYLIYRLCFYKLAQAVNSLYSFLNTSRPELLTIRIFEELIKGATIDMRLGSVDGFVLKMEEKKLEPSPFILSWIITRCGKRYDYTKIMEIMNNYLASNKVSNISMAPVQAAIKQLSHSTENLHHVEELIQRTIHFKKDLDYYNSMLNYNAFKGDIKAAKNILKQMSRKNITPNTYSYNCLLDYFVKNKDLHEMKEIYTNFMLSLKNAKSNTIKREMQNTAKIFITKYIELACNVMDPGLAESLINEANELDLTISSSIYLPLMECYSKLRNHKAVIRIYQDVKVLNLGYEVNLFLIYLDSACKVYGLEKGLNEFFEILRLNKYKPAELDALRIAHAIGANGTAKDLVTFFSHPLIKPVVTKICYDSAYRGLLTRYNEGDMEQIYKFNNL